MRLPLIAGGAFFAFAFVAQGQTSAQQPVPLPESGSVQGRIEAGGAVAADGAAFACYALDTAPNSRWTVRVASSAFTPEVWVARGALCNVANPAHRQVAGLDGEVEVAFNSPGGRYLVLVRSQGGVGDYTLDARGGSTRAASSQPAGSQTAAVTEDARVALMRRQSAELESRRQAEAEAARSRAEQQRLAEAQAAAQRRAAERRRREERSAFWGAVVSGAVQAMNEVTVEMAAENARMMEAQQRQLAQQQEQARHRQEQERLAREWEARNSGTNRSSSGATGQAPNQQTQDRAAAEASARRLSQQQNERRLQEQALIRQAEERRLADQRRLAEMQNRALLNQRNSGEGAPAGPGGSGPGGGGSGGGASASRSPTTLTFQNPYGFREGDSTVTLSAQGLNVTVTITDAQDILGQPRIYARGEFCNTLTSRWVGGQRISNIDSGGRTHATIRVDPGQCRSWSEWIAAGATTIYVVVQGGVE